MVVFMSTSISPSIAVKEKCVLSVGQDRFQPEAMQTLNYLRYNDNIALVRKVCSAADFVWSENPLELLGTTTVIGFDDTDSLCIKEHELTTEEIESLCDDLGVLGKKDFKQLLKLVSQDLTIKVESSPFFSDALGGKGLVCITLTFDGCWVLEGGRWVFAGQNAHKYVVIQASVNFASLKNLI